MVKEKNNRIDDLKAFVLKKDKKIVGVEIVAEVKNAEATAFCTDFTISHLRGDASLSFDENNKIIFKISRASVTDAGEVKLRKSDFTVLKKLFVPWNLKHMIVSGRGKFMLRCRW